MPNILIVDDDTVMQRLFQLQIRRAGADPFLFDDPHAALEALDAIQPQLAVLDFSLPGMNGIDLCNAIRAKPGLAAIPVIFVTGTADAPTLDRIRNVPNVQVLSKPFSPRRLVTLINDLLSA